MEMDLVVGAMETALINGVVGVLVAKLTTMIEENKKLRKELKDDLQDIKYEMRMINGAIKKHAESEQLRGWIQEVRDLAYDIEDKIDEFTGRVTCSRGAGWLGRIFHQQKTKSTRTEFAKEIKRFKQRAKEAYERRNRYLGTPSAPEPHAGPSRSDPAYIPESELVGIAEPKQELLELLKASIAEGQPEKLRVISIVGCRGIGKTILANVVFRSHQLEVPCNAWVVASECEDARGLLADILSKLLKAEEKDTTSTLAQLGENLRTHLQEANRYLIVIDDIQIELWWDIKSSFPVNTHGRIIVTTSIYSTAKTCSSDGCYVYRMQALSKDHSKALLLKEVFGPQCSTDFEGADSILKKCDGLPLALVNIAKLLKKSDMLKKNDCSKLCRELGSHLQKEESLSRMKQVLIHSYDNLPGHDLKTCFLSVSIFPKDHQIKRKHLIRRWLAEGFVQDVPNRDTREDVACGYFNKLIDRHVIQPVHTSNNAAVKTCRVHGIVLDFIVYKSVYENFITFIHDDELSENEKIIPARRLSLNSTSADPETSATNIDLSRIRSLTIFGHVGDYINFRECKLLRVLDLEKCKKLEYTDIQNICRSILLKYLSLRGTDVSKIPGEISNLHYLETLDIRETKVSILPIEVLKLPLLVHLFGKFKLPSQLNKVRDGDKLQIFFSQRSRLQTLAGFSIDENNGVQQILRNIRKLRKVKVWSEDAPTEGSIKLLVPSLQNRLFRENALQSLSINCGNHSIDFLDLLIPPCILTSVKLHGKLTNLPKFIMSLEDLELQLSSTALSNECLLALQSLEGLLYLKLVEDNPEFVDFNINIKVNGFPKLKRLCIQANKLPNMTIGQGAMNCLTSLQLLCEDISSFPLDYISHIKGLKEITLVNTISPDMKKAWETEAKKHENRPEIIS